MILILGGTHEGAALSKMLKEKGWAYTLSVATHLGDRVYASQGLHVTVNLFSLSSLCDYISAHKVRVVVDMTHPHAHAITAQAMEACERMRTPYLRFERKAVEVDYQSKQLQAFTDLQALITHLKACIKEGEKILITGVKHIGDFYAHFSPDQCVFRVMPSKFSMDMCEQAAVPLEAIVAVKAPCSDMLNKAIFDAYHIKHFVFKNSGSDSAFLSNMNALIGTQVKGYVLNKPAVNGLVFETIYDLLEAVENHLKT